ncbi:hypothetical protein GCM10023237_03130 [Streptomyces coeruleoprunus]
MLAAAPVGKGRLIDAASVLPALGAVPPGALTGTAAAHLVELADPLEPQAVLTRLRAAVASPGPLSLYITGQLHLDHKQHLPHLALARSTPATLRYTAVPWHWLAGELKVRRPHTTTVVVDLVADAATWARVGTDPSSLTLGPGIRLYGRIAPPPPRRRVAAPEYLKACTAIWRSGARPAIETLHEQAAAQAAAQTGTSGDLLLAGDHFTVPPHGQVPRQATPVPGVAGAMTAPAVTTPDAASAPYATSPASGTSPAFGVSGTSSAAPPADPHPAILAAAQAGRHEEAAAAAAAWEENARRTHGADSPQAIHWLEVRADLARLARDPVTSCHLWMTAAHARLQRRQAPDHPDVEGAVDRAHHQWEHITDPEAARAFAPALVALRRRVPGRQRGALQAVQRRLERWHATSGA